MPARRHPKQTSGRLKRTLIGGILGTAIGFGAAEAALSQKVHSKVKNAITARGMTNDSIFRQNEERIQTTFDREFPKLPIHEQTKLNQKRIDDLKRNRVAWQNAERKAQRNLNIATDVEVGSIALKQKLGLARPLLGLPLGLSAGAAGVLLGLSSSTRRQRREMLIKGLRKIRAKEFIIGPVERRQSKYKADTALYPDSTQIQNLIKKFHKTIRKKSKIQILEQIENEMLRVENSRHVYPTLHAQMSNYKYFLVKGKKIVFTDDPRNK